MTKLSQGWAIEFLRRIEPVDSIFFMQLINGINYPLKLNFQIGNICCWFQLQCDVGSEDNSSRRLQPDANFCSVTILLL